VTASFDDHTESSRISTLKGDPRVVGLAFLDSTSGQRLPIIRPGMNAPLANAPATRGILEKRDREFQTSDVVSSTRSIRFSPDSTLQSRSIAVPETGEPGGPFESEDQEKKELVLASPPAPTSAPPATPYPNFHNAHKSASRSEPSGHVRISRVGRQGMYISCVINL
jgi:hypothetical protein